MVLNSALLRETCPSMCINQHKSAQNGKTDPTLIWPKSAKAAMCPLPCQPRLRTHHDQSAIAAWRSAGPFLWGKPGKAAIGRRPKKAPMGRWRASLGCPWGARGHPEPQGRRGAGQRLPFLTPAEGNYRDAVSHFPWATRRQVPI